MKPTVSINLCCYNSEKYLRETLQSIVNQTYKDWELVIINDGSKDSTESIISEYIKQGYPIIYHYQENKGLGASRNEALKLSSGEYIAFIDHDDIWMPQKLENQTPLFKKNPKVGLVYCNTIFFIQSTGKERVLYKNSNQPVGMIFSKLLSHYFLSMETVVIRRECLNNLNEWFDERFNVIEEADLFIRISHDWAVDYVPELLAKWRIHSESSSWTKRGLFGKELKVMLEKYRSLFTDFDSKYRKQIEKVKAKIAYYEAMEEWMLGNRNNICKLIIPHIFIKPKLLALLILSVLPYDQYAKLLRFFGRHA